MVGYLLSEHPNRLYQMLKQMSFLLVTPTPLFIPFLCLFSKENSYFQREIMYGTLRGLFLSIFLSVLRQLGQGGS